MATKKKSFEENLPLQVIKDENITIVSNEEKIAPGMKVSGTFLIDTTGTEVQTNYKISVGKVIYLDEVYDNFSLEKVKASYIDSTGNLVEEDLIINNTSDASEATGDILLENIDKPITIEIIMLWNYIDDAENTLGINEATFEVPVTITVTQKD